MDRREDKGETADCETCVFILDGLVMVQVPHPDSSTIQHSRSSLKGVLF